MWAGRVVYMHKADRTRCSARRQCGFTRTFSRVHSAVRLRQIPVCSAHRPQMWFQDNLLWTRMRLVCKLHYIHLADIFVYSEWVKCGSIVARRTERTNPPLMGFTGVIFEEISTEQRWLRTYWVASFPSTAWRFCHSLSLNQNKRRSSVSSLLNSHHCY